MFSGAASNDLIRRAVFAFDLSSIPANSTITDVTLTLYMSRTEDVGNVDISLHRVRSGDTGPYDWSGPILLADVQGWYETPASNFGWIVIGDELNGQSARRFDTREHPIASRRPQLEITYEPETPVESVTWGRVKDGSID